MSNLVRRADLGVEQAAALDISLHRLKDKAWEWLAAMGAGKEDGFDGTAVMANLWNTTRSEHDSDLDWYRRADVSQAMICELARWHSTDENVREQFGAIIEFAEGSRFLDFGGGIGTLAIAMALAYPAVLVDVIEPGPWARAFIAERAARLGARVRIVDEPEGHYNTIVGMDVVEHLAEPVSFLHMAHDHLVDEGVVAMNWVFCQTPSHPQHVNECTDKSIAFHKMREVLFGEPNPDAVVHINGWPSVHRRKS